MDPAEILTVTLNFVTELARKGVWAPEDLFVAVRSIELCLGRQIEAHFGPRILAENQEIAFEVAKRIRVVAITQPDQVIE